MNLAVFDLDGTLTTTFAVDVQCFVQAFRIALNIERLNTNWTEYHDVTDSGLVLEAFNNSYGRDPEHAEVSRFIECFLSLLTEAHSNNTDSFGQIPGAAAFLTHLQQHRHWCAAIATGSWERCARFKMTTAGINANGMPAAFAEDGPGRQTIVEAAITRACAEYRRDFEKIVLVGDAVWDVQTAQRLDLPFIGVGSREQAALLRNAGSRDVIEDFLDHKHCLELFEMAKAPNLKSHRMSGRG